MSSNIVINRVPSTEEAQDAVGAAVADSIVYDDAANSIRLSGDENAPGADKIYGTDSAGVKGYYTLAQAFKPVLSAHAGDGAVAFNAVSQEKQLAAFSLPTVAYATTVILFFRSIYLPGAGHGAVTAWSTLIYQGTDSTGTLVGATNFSQASINEQDSGAVPISWAANAPRDIYIAGRTTAAGTYAMNGLVANISSLQFAA